MSTPFATERRDPASGFLQLGTTLAGAGRLGKTGEVRIQDQGRIHRVRLLGGTISDIRLDDGGRYVTRDESVKSRAERLFELKRPLVTFDDAICPDRPLLSLKLDQVVVSGILKRRELFIPNALVERIPVNTLKLNNHGNHVIRGLRLTPEERRFVGALSIPTPVAMALWKRGLPPQHAAALVMALNLLACFDEWDAGVLPRLSEFQTLARKQRAATSDWEILGLPENADDRTLDRAFRRISYRYHPDRLLHSAPADRVLAEALFQEASAAHAKLKRRRKRPVTCDTTTPVSSCNREPWRELLRHSRMAARNGDRHNARAFAVKTLAASPPPFVVAEVKALLREVA